MTAPDGSWESVLPTVNITRAFPVGGLETGAALVIESQQSRWFDIMASIGAIRVSGAGSGVIDQAEIRADVGFHKVFFIN